MDHVDVGDCEGLRVDEGQLVSAFEPHEVVAFVRESRIPYRFVIFLVRAEFLPNESPLIPCTL